jgi:hypothetical protein
MVVLDISATQEKRSPDFKKIKETRRRSFYAARIWWLALGKLEELKEFN